MIVLTKLKELQLFIEAAEMIGGDGWSPTAEQWAKIRERIMVLKPDEMPLAPPAPVYAPRPLVPQVETAWLDPPHHPQPQPALFGEQMSPAQPMSPAPGHGLSSPSMGGSDPTVPTKPRILPDGSADPLTFK